VGQVAPELVSLLGIGTDHAATLLIVALRTTPEVEEPGLLRQPLRSLSHRGLLWQGGAASSQPKVGNREAYPVRCSHDLSGSDAPRQSHQGIRREAQRLAKPAKSKPEIIRCLKRYVAREAYRVLISCWACSSPTGPQEEGHLAAGSHAA
jgi:hypothetical protein